MKKSNVFNIICIVIIIILIILLLVQCTRKQEVIKETGNVDIFEINCDKNDKCTTDTSVNKDKNDKDNVNVDKKIKSKVSNSSVDKKNDDNADISDNDDIDLSVSDNSVTWSQETKLDIFTNSMYNTKMIAPTSSNTYQFKIKNNNEYDISYSIDFKEKNVYGIDMRYRLRKDNQYVRGEEWLKYDELDLNNIKLGANKSDTYYLEWKWFEGENDTIAGINSGIGYSLNIRIKANSL